MDATATEESNPQLLSIKLVAQYSKRFGHAMPRDVAENGPPIEELNQTLQNALATGTPIPGWAERQGPLSCIVREDPIEGTAHAAPTSQDLLEEIMQLLQDDKKVSPELAAKLRRLLEKLAKASVRLLRLPEVLTLTALSRSSLYALLKAQKFPQQLRISDRAMAFVESEVHAWIADRVRARAAGTRDHGAAA